MREFSDGFRAHLNSGATTLCTCWIIKRVDGVKLGFTDHDHTIELEGTMCQASSGLKSTQAVSSLGLSTDNQEVAGALTGSSISPEDIVAGRYDDAEVEIWMVNWEAPEESHLMRVAHLGEVNQKDQYFTAELRGLTALLDQVQGRTFSRNCDAILGDQRCGFLLDNPAFKGSGEVVHIKSRLSISVSGLEEYQTGWFNHGYLKWTSGPNLGTGIEVAEFDQDSGRILFWNAPSIIPQIGDQFDVSAGCDKTFGACKSKFNNHLNFRGFPHLPGTDFVLGYVDKSTIHDGSALSE